MIAMIVPAPGPFPAGEGRMHCSDGAAQVSLAWPGRPLVVVDSQRDESLHQPQQLQTQHQPRQQGSAASSILELTRMSDAIHYLRE